MILLLILLRLIELTLVKLLMIVLMKEIKRMMPVMFLNLFVMTMVIL